MKNYRVRHAKSCLGLAVLWLNVFAACSSPDETPADAMDQGVVMTPDAAPDLPADAEPRHDTGSAPDQSAPDSSSGEDQSALDAASDMGEDQGLALDLSAILAAMERDVAKNNATAVSVAIWYKERIIWVGGVGQLSEAMARAPDEQTQFMIGSDTKKIASLAFLQRVEANQATVDTTFGSLFPDLTFPRATGYPEATAHELMTHQGGLQDYLGSFPMTTDDEALRRTITTTLPQATYALAPPGQFYNYSNPGFSVLGLMTEQLAGRPWADVVEQDLFAPLGMTRTVARKQSVDQQNAAPGVGVTSNLDTTIEPVSLAQTWEDAYVRPAGLVWSTPSDQVRLAKFLVDGDAQILSDALRERVTTAQTPVYPDLPGDYGYGLNIARGINLYGKYYDMPLWIHGGNTLTHSSAFYVLPDQRFAISILSNGLGDDFIETLVVAISELVELPAPVTPPPVEFDAEALDALTGVYIDMFNVGRVQITREGDSLQVAMPDLDGANIPYEPELSAISTRVWRLNVQNQELVVAFFEGDDGTMYMTHRAFVARRDPGLPVGVWRPYAWPDKAAIERALRRAAMDPVPAHERALLQRAR